MLAKKATIENNKIKVLLFGGPGTKKSLTALTFPKPLVLDLEKSTAHYGAIDFIDFYKVEVDSRIENIKNPIVALKNLMQEINSGLYNGIVETLVIDPVTDLLDFYESMLVLEFENNLKKSTSKKNSINELNAIEKTKWYAFRKRKFKALIQSILNINLNIVFIARHKLVWGNKNGQNMPIDETYDGHELLEYLVDVVGHFTKNADESINKYFKKSRLGDLNNYDIEIYDDMIEAIKSEGKAQKYFSDRATKKIIERNAKEKFEKKETERLKLENDNKNKYFSSEDIESLEILAKSKIVSYDCHDLIDFVLTQMSKQYKTSMNLNLIEKKYLPNFRNLINMYKKKKEESIVNKTDNKTKDKTDNKIKDETDKNKTDNKTDNKINENNIKPNKKEPEKTENKKDVKIESKNK